MTESQIVEYIKTTFPDTEFVPALSGTFFFNDGKRMFPFVTIVTSDEYDQFSNLARAGVFRLNIGISKETFRSMFDGSQAHEFTVLDKILPHPVYGKMNWICVLNPSDVTFEKLKPMITEAHAISAKCSRGL